MSVYSAAITGLLQFAALPSWLQEYLDGSAMELYEVAMFPWFLVGQPFTTVACYLLEEHRAVLLGLGLQEDSQPSGSAAQDILLLAPLQQVWVCLVQC